MSQVSWRTEWFKGQSAIEVLANSFIAITYPFNRGITYLVGARHWSWVRGRMAARCGPLHKKLKTAMVATYVKTVILERWFFYSQIGSAFNLSVVTQIKIKTKR